MDYLWTTITVENLDESIDFYSDLAKLKAVRRFQAGPGVEIAFLGNGAEHETQIELVADSGHGSIGFSDFISIGFAVDSMDAMLETVRHKNIPVHSGPVETPGFRFFGIKDPDGLHVQFFEKKQGA